MKQIKELLVSLLNLIGMAVWVEAKTVSPNCTYYFGPFITEKEASLAKEGYVEDLESEKAQSIQVTIKRFRPHNLTVIEDGEQYQSYPKMRIMKRPSVLS
ncbi:MAG: DUF1816 domain-containing protein [Microcystaceae cyanobacterium]